MTASRILVVNADDFGLTSGICEGILRAHDRGVVTSTSVLTVGPAFASRAAALRDAGVPAGLHLCAVGEDPPLLTSGEIPTLVDDRGRFPLSWRQFVARAATRRVDPADLEREFDAQREALGQAGIVPTHVDTHQNLHLWPAVGDVVVRMAVAHRIPVLRVTRTRRWGPVSAGVRLLSSRVARRARSAGLTVPDQADGLDTAGAVDAERLRSMIDRFAAGEGHADVTVHPGADPDPDRVRYRWGYSWPRELEAVCDRGVAQHITATGFTLGSFRDLAEAAQS